MALEPRLIVQEIEFPTMMSKEYLEFLLDTLPKLTPHDPLHPEWRATPHLQIDLQEYGFVNAEKVWIKNEADFQSNPQKLLKDRRAHELGPVAYRRFAENLWRQDLNGTLITIPLPRFCEVGAGNAALSQAAMNAKLRLPPPKVLLDNSTPAERIEKLRRYPIDIYLAPLGVNIFTGKNEPYTAGQIRMLTNNQQMGHDVTSSRLFRRDEDFYDWHVHEAFNHFTKQAGQIYVPAGSEELFAHYLGWQRLAWMNGRWDKDPRLQVAPEIVTQLDIFGAVPSNSKSIAHKLTGMKPYVPWGNNDVQGAKLLRITGQKSGIYPVSEEYISLAQHILEQEGIESEPSAAAALGLYLQHHDQGLTDQSKEILVVNTGKGI